MVLLVLSACNLGGNPEGADGNNADTPADSNNGDSGAPVTISFAVQEFERATYNPLVEQFNTDNPDIRVQLVSIDELYEFGGGSFDPSDYARSIVSGADVANLFSVDASAIEAGLFTDLTPLIDADTSFDRDDFYPGAFGPVSQGNSVYMLPSTMQVNLISYNKDLWAANGLPEPDLNWTWSDMIAAAEQLAQTRGDEVDVYGLLEFGGGFLFLLSALSENGINLLQTPAEDIQLDDPVVIATLEQVKALADSGAIFAEDVATSFDELPNLVLDQRAGMWSPDILSFGQEPAEPTFEVGTLPHPNTQSALFGRSASGFVMSSGTQYPEQSWRWLTFISQQNIDSAFQQGNIISVIPARRSIAEQTGYWDDIDEETARVIQTVVEQPAEPVSIDFQNITNLFEVLNTAVTNVTNDEQDPDQALREAQASFEESVAEIALTPQPTPDTGPVVVSTPVADIAPEGATTITFSTLTSFGGAGDIRALARTFNENNPDLFVEITTPDFSGGGGVNLENVAAGADCFSWWGAPGTNEFTATLDLQPLIDADATFERDDYPAGLLTPFQQGDGLYGLPYTVNFRTLYYEQEMFEAAGLESPNADWTLDDFLNAAQQLTSGSGSNEQYGYAAGSSQTQDLEYFVNQLGAEITTNNNTQPNFTDPSVIEATKFYVDLVSEFSPHEKLSGYTNDGWENETFQLISDGRVGMWLDTFNITASGIADATIASAPPPLPSGSIDTNSIDLTGLYISAQAADTNACWRWINYLSQDTTNLEGNYPARTSVAESDAFAAEASPGAVAVYAAYREALNQTDSVSNQNEFDPERVVVENYWYYRAVDRAIQGEDLERELTEAQELTEDYLTCRQADTDAHTCATQVDPDYDGFLQPSQEETSDE